MRQADPVLTMGAAYSSSSSWSRRASRAYWLPPGRIGNGLDAETWAVLIDADAGEMILLLNTLRDAGIGAYAEALVAVPDLGGHLDPRPRRGRNPRSTAAGPPADR